LEEYQVQQLEKLLHHCYKNVPYYRKIFDERGIKPKDIQGIEDLKRLPYLDRGKVRENFKDLVAQNYSESQLVLSTTGGSTGTPMSFYGEVNLSDAIQSAFVWRFWNWAGIKFGDRCVELRGRVIDGRKVAKRTYWQFDKVEKRLILSSYHMNEGNLPKYIELIRDFEPRFMHVYPSTIHTLARFMRGNNVERFKTLKGIVCSSESLYPFQRDEIESVLGCCVFDHYGQGEHVVLATQCEHRNNYHVIPEYGISTLIDSKGAEITEAGRVGEIVGTGFNNYAMPFVNYRTMDYALLSTEQCVCGRTFPLLERIEGRLQEMVVLRDGRLVPLTPFFAGPEYAPFSNVLDMQFTQEKEGQLVIRIVRDVKYSSEDERLLEEHIALKTNECLDVDFEYVQEIPRSKIGKHNFLIQKLPVKS